MTDIVENDPGRLSDPAGVREYKPEVKAKPRICSARGPHTQWQGPYKRLNEKTEKAWLDFKVSPPPPPPLPERH